MNDDSKFKRWTCVYPIYLDAKRKCNVNERRIPREKSCMWPVAEEMAKAATKLGLMTVYEVRFPILCENTLVTSGVCMHAIS